MAQPEPRTQEDRKQHEVNEHKLDYRLNGPQGRKTSHKSKDTLSSRTDLSLRQSCQHPLNSVQGLSFDRLNSVSDPVCKSQVPQQSHEGGETQSTDELTGSSAPQFI